MMKVGPDGRTPIYDPSGELPGTLVPRPFVEYPKAVRRVRLREDGSEEIITFVAHSKSEELKIMSDTADLSTPLSPLEKERNELAEELATQQAVNGKLANQLEHTLAKLEELSNTVAKLQVAPQAQATAEPAKTEAKPASGSNKPTAEALALANRKQ
jgi:DNA-binding protein H-NS